MPRRGRLSLVNPSRRDMPLEKPYSSFKPSSSCLTSRLAAYCCEPSPSGPVQHVSAPTTLYYNTAVSNPVLAMPFASLVSSANVPMEISPVDAVATANDHLCGNPGATHPTGGEAVCSCSHGSSTIVVYPVHLVAEPAYVSLAALGTARSSSHSPTSLKIRWTR